MISYCGSSMFTLAAECDKLSYYALSHNRHSISEEDVRTVCSADLSADSFALANSILDGRGDKALDVLAVMKFRRIDPIVVLSEVSKAVCDMISIRSLMDLGKSSAEIATTLKMNEYKVKIYMSAVANQPMKKLRRTLELCTEADIALKLSPQGYMAIERLVCSL
jgi:DNA polymerase-3 subunit delta